MTEHRPVEFTTIDFDDAHNHWIQNKRKLSNGMYRYICIGFFKNGNQCNRNPLVGKNTCNIHDFPQNIALIKHEDTYHKSVESSNKTKPQPKKTTKIATEIETANQNEIKIKQRIHISGFVRNLWKMYCTLPVVEPIDNSQQKCQDRIIDPYKETIRIQTEPLKYVPFKQLQKAFEKYGSIDKVRNPDTIRKNRYNILDVAYYLQIMLIFLEGLNEMTKLSTKHVCVMMMKTRILMFVNYDTNMHLHTTEAKWRAISHNIRDEILYILDDIFDEIGE